MTHAAKLGFAGLVLLGFGLAARGADKTVASTAGESMELGLGGVGGVYFLAAPGPLIVDVQKRDLNRRGATAELRAILFGPDRQVLGELRLADDGRPRGGGPGPVQRGRLRTEVASQGVYGLNITVSQDRYGEEMVWGFHTNCPRYLIETSRGHRDERHMEPIVFNNPELPGDVCFLPSRDRFEISLANLPEGGRDVELYDADGALLDTLRADQTGQVARAIAGDASRPRRPWRLHLPRQRATVHIDGVTRWSTRDRSANLSYWTTKTSAFFPFADYRWLLAPYSRTQYGPPGSHGTIALSVNNNADRPVTVDLALEFPSGGWSIELPQTRVALPARRGKELALQYTVPPDGDAHVCRVRATPVENPDFTTYSTLTVRAGEAPAARPLAMPLTLRPYQHENEQLGYAPDYPLQSQLYFDLTNRAMVRTDAGLIRHRDTAWQTLDLSERLRASTPRLRDTAIGMASTKIAFDRDNDVYLLGAAKGHQLLLHSSDGGESFTAYPLPNDRGAGTLDFEQFSGHNVPDGPPPIVRFRQTAADPQRIWRRINDLELIVFEKKDGRLTATDPVVVSRRSIGFSAHSGAPSSVVSRAGKIHVVWGEATDPAEKVSGVPTFVATYDCATRRLGEPALVAYGPPANDVHNTPSITMDSRGYLHVLAGTHGSPFPYAKSLRPNDAAGGWTPAELVGAGLNQTYIGFVCGPDDALHLAYRLWQSRTDPHPASHHAVLAYSRKPAGQPWDTPRKLVVPPFSEYSVFYHRLTIDRRGRLFLSYDYWSTFWFYRTDHFGDRRAVLMSPDGGGTWKLAAGSDFAASSRLAP